MSDNDADVLFGDGGETLPNVVTVAGEQVAVRELSWVASMRIMPKLRGLLDDLRALVASPDDVSADAVDALLFGHPDAWIALCQASADKPAEWLDSLSATDGDALRSAVWAANAGFFSQRLTLPTLVAAGLRASLPSPSPNSLPTSSAPDSDPITTPSPTD